MRTPARQDAGNGRAEQLWLEDVLQAPRPGALLITDALWQRVVAALRLPGRLAQVARGLVEGETRLAIARKLKKADGSPLAIGTIHRYIATLRERLNAPDAGTLVLRLLLVVQRLAPR